MLGCVIAEELFRRFPGLPEGQLTRTRSALVRREALAEVAQILDVRSHLRTGSNLQVSPAVLANALEALFGAVFMDGGYDAARDAVLRAFGPLLDRLDPQKAGRDAKSQLQERLQARKLKPPEYRLLRTQGPDNHLTFEVACLVHELNLETGGTGPSLQRAQQQAAQAMLEKLPA